MKILGEITAFYYGYICACIDILLENPNNEQLRELIEKLIEDRLKDMEIEILKTKEKAK